MKFVKRGSIPAALQTIVYRCRDPIPRSRTTVLGLIGRHDRVAITGPSNAGKTTLSNEVTDRPVIHLDDLRPTRRPHALSAIEAASGLKRYVLEGCAVVDCLARGLEPDLVVWLDEPLIPPGRIQRKWGEDLEARFRAWERCLTKTARGA